jgi:murein DD-endopeptidase MepM/ murein hydrolase activator NlpD
MRRFRALVVIALLAVAGQAAVTYRVTRGDTLARIAKRNHTTVGDLAGANGLKDPNRIREGQVLTIPEKGGGAPTTPATVPIAAVSDKQVVVGGDGQRRHTVQKGETLARIAAKYGTTSTELAKANNIANPNLVRIGAQLAVPGGGEPWLCPVQGQVWFSDSWGHPRPGGRRHRGTDLFAFRGTPVVAPVGGTVRHASGKVAGNAFYLHADDGNVYYGAHLDKLEVSGGARVERGGRIGTVGSTGNAEGLTPHLHLEIHLHGTEPINPFATAEKWCKR